MSRNASEKIVRLEDSLGNPGTWEGCIIVDDHRQLGEGARRFCFGLISKLESEGIITNNEADEWRKNIADYIEHQERIGRYV